MPNLRDPNADAIVDASGDFGRTLAAGFAEKLAAALEHARRGMVPPVAAIQRIVADAGGELEAGLYDALVSSYVIGGAKVLEKVPLSLVGRGLGKPPSVPVIREILYPMGEGREIHFPIFSNAVRQLKEAEVLSPETYYSLAAAARQNAFTISGEIQEKTLGEIQEILAENLLRKTDRADFLDEVVKRFPELPIGEAHLEQVFRNNVNAAYSDGGELTLADPLVEDSMPFRAYYVIHDDRARLTHRAMEDEYGLDGKGVFWAQDPVWKTFRPPWDWNCRCGWNALSVRRAANKGVAAAQKWLETGVRPPVDELLSAWPPFRPDPRWDRIGVAA